VADAARPVGTVRVQAVRVVDGDTLVARVHGHLERVRLIGVDAPELAAPERATPGPGRRGRADAPAAARRPGRPGRAAYLALSRLVRPGAVLYVAPDLERRDRYGRSLLYVWTGRGVFVNEALIREGHARAMVIAPNDRYAGVLLAAEAAAHRWPGGR
jgi:micrococcal nuclease